MDMADKACHCPPTLLADAEGYVDTLSSHSSRLAAAVQQCTVQDAACFCTAMGSAGTYREPTKCSGWYQCTSEAGGFYFACPAGLLFDTACSCCTWPSQVQVREGVLAGSSGNWVPAWGSLSCSRQMHVGVQQTSATDSPNAKVCPSLRYMPHISVFLTCLCSAQCPRSPKRYPRRPCPPLSQSAHVQFDQGTHIISWQKPPGQLWTPSKRSTPV